MKQQHFLRGARVYLSGPMDFVASRADEKKLGWRNRVGDFLRAQGAIVFDPWFKPAVRGAQQYGLEDIHTIDVRESGPSTEPGRGRNNGRSAPINSGKHSTSICAWSTRAISRSPLSRPTFTASGRCTRSFSRACSGSRCFSLVRRSLFRRSICSAATPRAKKDAQALQLLDQLVSDVPIKPNPRAIPSLWYMPLVGSGNFFDGFGFAAYREQFDWARNPDGRAGEAATAGTTRCCPFWNASPIELPQRWDNRLKKYVPNDDWLLWELEEPKAGGGHGAWAHESGEVGGIIAELRCDRDRRRRRRVDVRVHRRPARASCRAPRTQCAGRPQDRDLGRRTLQFHQPLRRAGKLSFGQSALLRLGPRAATRPEISSRWSRNTASLSRKKAGPVVLRFQLPPDHRDVAGGMRHRGVDVRCACRVESVEKRERFSLSTNRGELECDSLVVATGGLSFATLGASDFGYRIAEQFGLG